MNDKRIAEEMTQILAEALVGHRAGLLSDQVITVTNTVLREVAARIGIQEVVATEIGNTLAKRMAEELPRISAHLGREIASQEEIDALLNAEPMDIYIASMLDELLSDEGDEETWN